MALQLVGFRRSVVLALVVLGLIGSLNACSTRQPTTSASQPAAVTAKVKAKITPAEYQARFGADADHVLIDVRTPEEFASGHIPGAVNISVDQLAQRLSEIPQDKPVVLYCRSGNRSNQAAQILERAGYTQIYDLGGIITWVQQGYPIQ